MQKEIKLSFHNQGLRSYIEVDLCAECPRQDNKGCCGYYSPVFYPTDLAYLLINKADIIDYIFKLDHLTILDSSVTVNNNIDGDSYMCRFHSKDKGCLIDQQHRESVCRHFVCPGIGWENEKSLNEWKVFFDSLIDYEIDLNQRLEKKLLAMGLSLRNPELRETFFEELLKLYKEETKTLPEFFSSMPKEESFTLLRTISYGSEWPL